MRYVVLLRGINVGGNSRVEMPKLKEELARLGYLDVTTYINSGNAFFETDEKDPREIEIAIERMLSANFGLDLHVVVRSAGEIERLMQDIPKSWVDTNHKYNVIFLRHSIDTPAILENFAPKKDIEEVIYSPGALLWSARTSDLTKSTMIKLAKSALYKEMTVRNINTTRKIAELMKSD